LVPTEGHPLSAKLWAHCAIRDCARCSWRASTEVGAPRVLPLASLITPYRNMMRASSRLTALSQPEMASAVRNQRTQVFSVCGCRPNLDMSTRARATGIAVKHETASCSGVVPAKSCHLHCGAFGGRARYSHVDLGGRKIQAAIESRECISKMKKSGLALAQWAGSAWWATSGTEPGARQRHRSLVGRVSKSWSPSIGQILVPRELSRSR